MFSEIKQQSYKGSYALVNKYLRENTGYYSYTNKHFPHKRISNSAYKPSIRFETGPGEQAQVDWGSFGKIEINGRIERLYCFIFVLGYSRISYIEFTIKQNLQTLENCHVNTFQKIGIPKTIVYDNMKTVVLKREKSPNGNFIPVYNPAFVDFARYYGFDIFACSPYWPRAKGKVEASVKYVRNNFMQGMKFKKNFISLEEINKKAQEWTEKVANIRIHGTTKETPIKRWLRERKYLRFPNNIPTYTSSPFMIRNSTKDGLIQYKSNFYSVPEKCARRKLFVKEINTNGVSSIAIYYQDTIIAEHLLSYERGEWIVNDKHFIRESHHKKIKKRQLNRRAKKTSPSTIGIRPLSYYDQFIPKMKNG